MVGRDAWTSTRRTRPTCMLGSIRLPPQFLSDGASTQPATPFTNSSWARLMGCHAAPRPGRRFTRGHGIGSREELMAYILRRVVVDDSEEAKRVCRETAALRRNYGVAQEQYFT